MSFAGSSSTLAVVMGARAIRSGKFMPAGMVASLRLDAYQFQLLYLLFLVNIFMCGWFKMSN